MAQDPRRPTRHRQEIIDALQRWTRRRSTAPTLEELCAEMGMSPRQKATLQRWLQTLRGIDVEWEDHVPRSLRLLHPQDSEEPQPTLDARVALRYLATGLMRWSELRPQDRGRIPGELRLGLAYASLLSLQHGVPFPGFLPEFLAWAESPLRKWKPALSIDTLAEDAALLEDGVPTNLTRVWSVSGTNIVAQVQEQVMRDALMFCRGQFPKDPKLWQEAYRSLRELVIRRPCLTYIEYRRLLAEEPFVHLRDFIRLMYVDLSDLDRYESYPRCPRCKYVRRRRADGTFVCRDPFCERLAAAGSYAAVPPIPGDQAEQWKVVTPGIFYFVTLPGLWEIALAEKLVDAGLRVTLWPDVDAYDLLVHLPRNIRWALDVKDWSDVHEQVHEIERRYDAARTVVVFPDERHLPLSAIREQLEPELDGVELRSVTEVLAEISRASGQGRAG